MSQDLLCPCFEGDFIEPGIANLLASTLRPDLPDGAFHVRAIEQCFRLDSGRWLPTPMLRYHMCCSPGQNVERAFRHLPVDEGRRVAPLTAHILDNLSSWHGFNGHCAQMEASFQGGQGRLVALYLPRGVLLYQEHFPDEGALEALRHAQFKNGDTGAYLRYLAPVNIARHKIVSELASIHPWLSVVLTRMTGEQTAPGIQPLNFILSGASRDDRPNKDTTAKRRK